MVFFFIFNYQLSVRILDKNLHMTDVVSVNPRQEPTHDRGCQCNS